MLLGGVAAERALIVAKPELGGGALMVAKPELAAVGGGGRVSYVDEVCLGGGAVESADVGGTGVVRGGLLRGDAGRPLMPKGDRSFDG